MYKFICGVFFTVSFYSIYNIYTKLDNYFGMIQKHHAICKLEAENMSLRLENISLRLENIDGRIQRLQEMVIKNV
jgi:hypothetical protein